MITNNLVNALNEKCLNEILEEQGNRMIREAKAARLEEILTLIKETLSHKQSHYRNEPQAYLPVEVMAAQLYVKAARAFEVANKEGYRLEKLNDELKDTACYAILLLMRTWETTKPGEIPALQEGSYENLPCKVEGGKL